MLLYECNYMYVAVELYSKVFPRGHAYTTVKDWLNQTALQQVRRIVIICCALFLFKYVSFS